MVAGYQFIHWESYSLEGVSQKKTDKKTGKVREVKKRGAREIIAEGVREDGNCPHVTNPEAPFIIGDPNQLLADLQEYVNNTKDAQGRKMRKDGHCLLAGVISLPKKGKQSLRNSSKSAEPISKKNTGID